MTGTAGATRVANMGGIADLSVAALREAIARGEVAPDQARAAYDSRIAAYDHVLGAYLHQASGAAGPTPARGGAAGDPASGRPLAGVPYALKDNLCVAGIPCTCGSRILDGYVPPYTATAVERLNAAGATLLGKTNMDEFAMGSSCEFSAYKLTRNPWDLALVPGGSSGGSAAAVAGRLAAFALGSDTGGSVRQPAAFCGIVGMKPTYGLVSRYGLVAFASSLDQIGPFTRDITDCAIVLSELAGHDPRDSTSVAVSGDGGSGGVAGGRVDYRRNLTRPIQGMRLGLPREYMGEGIEPGVRAAVEKAVETFLSLGAEVEDCSLPHTEYGVATYYIIAPAEASSNLARFDGMRYGHRTAQPGDLREVYEATRTEGFGEEVKRRIMIGTYVLSAGYYDAYYLRAQQARTLVCDDFARAFERFDALIGPTAPTVAFGIGAQIADPLAMYLNDVLTIPVNLAGLPAVSLPCGLAGGLPVGLQLIGPHFAEATLLQLGYAFEQASGVRDLRPPNLEARLSAWAAGGEKGVR